MQQETQSQSSRVNDELAVPISPDIGSSQLIHSEEGLQEDQVYLQEAAPVAPILENEYNDTDTLDGQLLKIEEPHSYDDEGIGFTSGLSNPDQLNDLPQTGLLTGFGIMDTLM